MSQTLRDLSLSHATAALTLVAIPAAIVLLALGIIIFGGLLLSDYERGQLTTIPPQVVSTP
jgi:hypothetical protein